VTSAKRIVEKESGTDGAFDRAATADLPPLKSGFVSTGLVEIGEGVRRLQPKTSRPESREVFG
jgi:hypothetical protein